MTSHSTYINGLLPANASTIFLQDKKDNCSNSLNLPPSLRQALEHLQTESDQNSDTETVATHKNFFPSSREGDLLTRGESRSEARIFEKETPIDQQNNFSTYQPEQRNSFPQQEIQPLFQSPSSSPSSDTSNPPNTTYSSLEIILALVAGATSKMNSLIAMTSASLSDMNGEIQEGMENIYQALQVEATNNLESQENESGWDKFWNNIGTIMASVLIVCTALTGNIEIAIAIGTMMVLKDSGVLSDIASGVSDLCMKLDPNMNPQTAQLIGDIVADAIGAITCVITGQLGSLAEKAMSSVKEGAKLIGDIATDTIRTTVGTLPDTAASFTQEAMGVIKEGAQWISDSLLDVPKTITRAVTDRVNSFIQETMASIQEAVKGTEQVTEDAAEEEAEIREPSSSGGSVDESALIAEQASVEDKNQEKSDKKFLDTIQEIVSPSESPIKETASDIKQPSSNTFKKLVSAIKKVNPFSYTPKYVNQAALGFVQSWTATQTSSAILQNIDFSNPTIQKCVEGIVGGLTVLTDLLVSGGALMGLGTEEGTKTMVNATLFKLGQASKLAAGIGKITAEVAQACCSGWEAVLTKSNSVIQAELEGTEYILNTISLDNQTSMDTTSRLISENFKEMTALMQTASNTLSSIAHSMYQA